MNAEQDTEILALLAEEKSFEKGFRQLVKAYQEPLYWHIRRMVHLHDDADDVIQNTFVKVFKHIGAFKGESKLYTWLYRIASNEAISFLNRKKKHYGYSPEEAMTALENSLKADRYFNGDEAQLLLAKAIETLPDRQKLVFTLRYYDELNYEDMAEMLDLSAGSLKASYHHAVKKVENYLKKNLDHVR